MKKYLLLLLAVILIAGLYFVPKIINNKTQSSEVPVSEVSQSLKEKVENYILHFPSNNPGSLANVASDRKACSVDIYGNDDTYIYGHAVCQYVMRDTAGPLFIANDINEPVRLSYTGSDFKLTNYEYSTSIYPGDKGTTPKDILAPKFLDMYIKNIPTEGNLLQKENLNKMLSQKPITQEEIDLLNKELSQIPDDKPTKQGLVGYTKPGIDTSNWKIWESVGGKFQIKYPNDWVSLEGYHNNKVVQLFPPNHKAYEVMLSASCGEFSNTLPPGIEPQNLEGIRAFFQKTIDNSHGSESAVKIESITLSGIPAIKMGPYKSMETGVEMESIYADRSNGIICNISSLAPNKDFSNYSDAFQGIIDSFKLN